MGKSYIEKCADYEESYRANPVLYKIHAFLVACIGYLCNVAPLWHMIIIFPIVLSIGIIVVGALSAIAVPALIVFFLILHSKGQSIELVPSHLFKHFYPINGVKIKKKDAPELFNLLKKICKNNHFSNPSEVYLTGDTTSLILVRPLMKTCPFVKYIICISFYDLYGMSQEQFEITLTDTLANLTPSGKFAYWMQYLTSKRIEILETVNNGPAARFGSKFIDNHCEQISAMTGVLTRWNMINADNLTVNNFNISKTGETLIAQLLIDKISERKYWDTVNKSIGTAPKPPDKPYTELKNILVNRELIVNADEMIREDLTKKTRLEDSSLQLLDRLEVMSYFAAREGGINAIAERISSAPDNIAANVYLPQNDELLIDKLNAGWCKWAEELWLYEYEKQNEINAKKSALETKAETSELTKSEKWEYFIIIKNEKDNKELMFEKIKEYLAEYPESASANYIYGAELLKENNPEGVSYIEKAVSLDPEIEIRGIETIINFNMENGREMEADLYIKRIREAHPILIKAIKERKMSMLDKKFISLDLPDEWVNRINEQLSNQSAVKDAYLVKADIKFIKERPVYLLFYTVKNSITDAQQIELFENLSKNLYLPAQTRIFMNIEKQEKKATINRKLTKIENSKIYSSDNSPAQ
jgi:hypothetical protein